MQSEWVESCHTCVPQEQILRVCFCLNLFWNCSTPEPTWAVELLPEMYHGEKRSCQWTTGKLGELAVSVSKGRPGGGGCSGHLPLGSFSFPIRCRGRTNHALLSSKRVGSPRGCRGAFQNCRWNFRWSFQSIPEIRQVSLSPHHCRRPATFPGMLTSVSATIAHLLTEPQS